MATSERHLGMHGALPGIASVALILAAALAAGASLLVAVGVIPDVRDIWAPQTEGGGGSTPAFWASVVANLVFATVMLVTAAGRRSLSRRWWRLVVLLGAGAIAQALMYLDASAAFHGPLERAMQPVRDRLRYAIAADAAAGVLVIVSMVWVAFIGRRASSARQ